MHRPSSTALAARARTLVEHMHAALHWVYAVPIEEADRHVLANTTLVSASRCDDLDVTLLVARGEPAAVELADLLAKTSFFAQSTLLASAYDDVGGDEGGIALVTLAHMAVRWDEEWEALFELHLAHGSPEVRRNAVTALLVVARTSGARAACGALLRSARSRETTPGTADLLRAIDEGLAALEEPVTSTCK